jgi:VWFA-related protein
MAPHAHRLAVSATFGTALLVLGLGLGTPLDATEGQDQAPTFRSTVDVVAVDVQVVDDEGRPVGRLTPDDFEVTISGKRRRVITADYIQSTQVDGRPFPETAGPQAVATNVFEGNMEPSGRVYILAFDVGSLTLSDSRAVVGSALNFIDRLLPNDMVGLYTFPIGSQIDPTTDHTGVRQHVAQVVGSSQGFDSRFHLSISEIIDINSEAARLGTLGALGGQNGRGGGFEDSSFGALSQLYGDESDTLRRVQVRECGAGVFRCVDEILQEAQSLAYYLEGRGTEGLNGLRSLITALGQYPGRKTVVMFSSGIPASDSAGGRPDLGDLSRSLGQDAAATNTSIYTLHVDTSDFRAMSAETRRSSGSPATRSRDRVVGGRVLEEFSGASGGALMRVFTGSGEVALDRVLRETSSHYLLGVEPEESDRDGKVRELDVKVNVDDVTVRSRIWVVVPERETS